VALDVGLVGVAGDQHVDGVGRRQGAQHVAELDPGAVRTGEGAKSGEQDARHGRYGPGNLEFTVAVRY
jgi:hypothetical protein